MKENQVEYNNGFIEVASYEKSTLLQRNFPRAEQLAFLLHNKLSINVQIKKLKEKTVILAETMVEAARTLNAGNLSKEKAQVNANDLNNSYILQKKAQEIDIIKNVTESYTRYLFGYTPEDDYHMQRDTLLKDLTICRAEFYLLKARYKSKKYLDWKMENPNIDVSKITEQGWEKIASEIYDENYFGEFGISIHKNHRSSSIQENQTQDAKAKILSIQDDIRNKRPILPQSNEEKDTIVLSLANRSAIISKIAALSKEEDKSIPLTEQRIR